MDIRTIRNIEAFRIEDENIMVTITYIDKECNYKRATLTKDSSLALLNSMYKVLINFNSYCDEYTFGIGITPIVDINGDEYWADLDMMIDYHLLSGGIVNELAIQDTKARLLDLYRGKADIEMFYFC